MSEREYLTDIEIVTNTIEHQSELIRAKLDELMGVLRSPPPLLPRIEHYVDYSQLIPYPIKGPTA